MTEPSKFYTDVILTKSLYEMFDMLDDKLVWNKPYLKYNLTEDQKADVKKAIAVKYNKFETDEIIETQDEDDKPVKKRKYQDCIHPYPSKIDKNTLFCWNCQKQFKIK